MAISNSEPKYTFISTGDKVAMYTLRVMCLDTIVIAGEKSFTYNDYYIQNLSTDKATAEEKAVNMSELMQLEFKGNAEFELNEIRRTRAAESAEFRAAVERAQAEKAEAEKAEFERLVSDNVMIMGKYIGMTPAEIAATDIMYLFWLAGERASNGKLQICAKIAHNYITANNLELPGYVGELNQPLTIDLTMIRQSWTQGIYSTLMHVCRDSEGHEIVFFSVAKKFKDIEPGDKFSITGTVKEHREGWNGGKQTIINKPKLV